VRLEDEQPLQHADLVRGEADSLRVLHQPLHALDERDELVVEVLDRPRGHLQRRVGILADLREREPAPRFALGVELRLVLDLSVAVRHAVGTLPPVDPRELKEIMSQGAIRPETPRDRQEREVLEADLDGSPVAGKPLRRLYRNFRPDADASIRALSGPPVWM